MKHAISLGLVLFGVWLLWSGHWPGTSDSGWLVSGLGLLSCLTALYLVHRTEGVDRETAPVDLTFRAVRYLPWLAWKVVQANVDVARRILHPGLPIQPHVVRVRASQRTDVGRVIYANSITLTPGTVTIDADGAELTVHALTQDAADDLSDNAMDRRVSSIEGDA